MKLKVDCDVESVMKLERAISVATAEVSEAGFEYTFTPGPDGLLRQLSVTVPVKRPELFSNSIDALRDVSVPTVTFATDEELVASVRAELHALESQLSFQYPLTQVKWQCPRFELIHETDDERVMFPVHAFSMKQETMREPKLANEAAVVRVVAARFRFGSLTVPLSFYREAQGEFDRYRFIAAFFNFYFVLEGLYGEGNTKNRLVELSFTRSRVFRDAVLNSLAAARIQNAQLFTRVETELAASNLTLDDAGVARFLVNTRGRLHHFTNSRKRLEGTPFTHAEFEPAAFLAKIVATFALTGEMVALGATVPA